MVGCFKDDCGLCFKFIDVKVLNVLPHDFGGFCFSAPLGHFAVDHGCGVGNRSISRAGILLQILFEYRVFFKLIRLLDFVFDRLWNEVGYLEGFFNFLSRLISFNHRSLHVFRYFRLDLIQLFLCESLLFLYLFILLLHSILFYRKCLFPCRLDKIEDPSLLLGFFFLSEVEP